MEFEQLLQRAKESDEWAFEQIFKMYRPLLVKQAIGDNGLDEDLYKERSRTLYLHSKISRITGNDVGF